MRWLKQPNGHMTRDGAYIKPDPQHMRGGGGGVEQYNTHIHIHSRTAHSEE
jgi:hypothetical protein